MNDIIKSLANKHLLHDKYGADGEVIEGDYYEFDERELVEFAQSIVKKCIHEIEFQYGGGNLMEDDSHNLEWDKAVECVSAMVRHRFGIK